MVNALYRINGGETIKRSAINQPLGSADPAFFAILNDPLEPDGIHIREPFELQPGQPRYGPKRQLGWAKICIPATNTMRNATQAEIDFFDVAEGQDEQAMDAIQAREQAAKHPFIARVLLALLRRLVPTINQQNAKMNLFLGQWASMKTIMASGATVAQMRSQIAALPAIQANLPDSLTVAQVAQLLRDDILDTDAPRRGA
jgi:hypothetical protein